MKNKRFYFGLFGVVLVFLLLCFFLFYFPGQDSRKLYSLSNDLFSENLSKDTISLHYTLANPSAYGLVQNKVGFSLFVENDYERSKDVFLTYQKKLTRLNPKHLEKEDVFAYENISAYLYSQLEGLTYEYYEEPLSPNSGIQSQLPILLAEYAFYQKEDVDDYLVLLNEIPSYFENILYYEQKKADAGLFMSSESATSVIAQCDVILAKESLDSNSHFLIKTFEERLLKLFQTGLISKEEMNSYLEQNKVLLSEKVSPAYGFLGDELFLLRNEGLNDKGLCYFPNGKDYYTYLVKSTTGSDKSIQELKQMLMLHLKKTQEDMIAVRNSIASLLPTQGNNIPISLPLDNPEAMIEDLKIRMSDEYPPFPMEDAIISCTLKKVDESLQNYVSPAFYLTPPIDNVLNNVIYINEKEPLEAIDCYTTLAHEGYPGHLYQSVYHILSGQLSKRSPFEATIYSGGYTEGWAYYVENNSYDYAKDLLPDNESKALVSDYFEICRLRRNQQLLLFSLLDIAIHYDGLDSAKTEKILMEFGIKDAATAQNVYRYIADEPGNYLKYCIGYLEILECKELAKVSWKENYSPLNFHTFFLECGPAPFPILQKEIKNKVF